MPAPKQISLFLALAASLSTPSFAQVIAPEVAPAPIQTGVEWVGTAEGRAAANLLVERLKTADLEGFAQGPAYAAQAADLLGQADAGVEGAAGQANSVLSNALAAFVMHIQSPVADVIYGGDWLRPQPMSRDHILGYARSAQSLSGFIQQQTIPNVVYSHLLELAKTQQLDVRSREKVVASLERARAFRDFRRFVLVDAAQQRLWMYENGVPVDSMKIVVGMPELPTPMIVSAMYYSTHNPYWHVPYHLVKKTVAPGVRKGGVAYLKQRDYQVIDRWDKDAAIIDPSTVDWAAAERTGDLKVRQLPNAVNSMGKIKFDFANPEGIYLHDTPTKEYFGRANRALSNGCVRLEDAFRFARWAYQGQPVPQTKVTEEHHLLPEAIPVFVTYMTAQAADGEIRFAEDLYQRDAPLLASMQAGTARPAAN